MTSKVTYLSALRTQAEHLKSGDIIITDAPVDNKGKGEAFSPTDLLATSLASCMLTIIGINAQEKGYDIDGTIAEVTKIMDSNPRRVGEIQINLFFQRSYSEKEKKLIENSARTCPVSKSLHPDLKQTIIFNYGH
ncbi:MAG: osmotically inducible protein OsmC [Bacteroidetes bacterium GWF2_38_335]|nr:MAG: osmotically inducible protein OsmC [Bacteroidetes bacterium GWF2_38_335]OFY80231.1 MAG: osmotically inducible protein OsmC [Bacteroidetes bacterium RIFOXYA12_FULL_38_20]HBS88742.1 osmotically inducible protein OsmC [Bacteroidales bacterium]